MYIPYSQKLSPGENFRQFHHPILLAKILSMNILSRVNDYRGYGNLYCIGEIYSTEHFRNKKVARVGETFVQQKFLAIWYMYIHKNYQSTFRN